MGAVRDFIEERVDIVSDHPFLFLGAVALGSLISLSSEQPNYGNNSYAGQRDLQEETISGLEKELEACEKRRNDQKCSAEQMIREAEEILDEIKNYRWEMFLPDCVKEVRNSLDIAVALEKNDDIEATISAARNALLMAQLKKKKLVEYELAWERMYQSLLELRTQAEQFAEQCTAWKVKVQTDEREEEADIDVDYWTSGRLGQISRQMELGEVSRECSTEELQGLVESTTAILNQMKNLPQEAAEAFLDSQQRLQLCESVYNALFQRGWTLEREDSYGYEDEDDRNPMYLQMQNPAEIHMDFQFTSQGGFRVSVSFRGVGNQDLRQHLEYTVLEILRQEGFTVTEFHS